MTPAALDDELAKKMGAESIDELKERIEQMISSRKEDAARREQGEELFKALLEQTSFELPPKLVEAMIEENLQQLAGSESDKSADEIKAEHEEKTTSDVNDHLRRTLIMDAIADKFEASREDLNQQIFMAAYQSGRKPEEVAKQLQESGRIYEVMSDIRQHKAIELFLSKVLEIPNMKEEEWQPLLQNK